MPLSTLNILLADENIAGKIIAEEILYKAGILFRLFHVLSLKDAISYLCREKNYINVEKPDLIILEAGLLYRDTESWSDHFRSDERFKYIPTIALLLFKEEELYFRRLGLPVDCFIIKPINLDEMDNITNTLKEFALTNCLRSKSL